MQSKSSTENVRSLNYSQESAIFETYLMSLVNEDEAVEIISSGIHDVINTFEDALSVIRLTQGDYPASVPVGLRRLISLVEHAMAKATDQNPRHLNFLRWSDAMLQTITDSSKTSEYVPVFLEIEQC